MSMYVMKSRTIPVNEGWDVIVIGGGPSGCTAAASAAREGAKTLLIEATGALGGMSTLGLVPTWCPFSYGGKMIYQGLAEKILIEAKKDMPHIAKDKYNWVAIDPERLKRIYDDLIIGLGATVLFNTMLSAVEKDDNGNISAIIVSNKAGLTAYKAKVYVDCTGDADLSAWAGADFLKGIARSGDLQPATLCFILNNVDDYAFNNGPMLKPDTRQSVIHKLIDSEKYSLITDRHMCVAQIGPGALGFNAGHIYNVDNTDPISLTKGLMEGRKLVEQIRAGLAEFEPKTFSNSFLSTTGSLLGVRESRRVIGEYLLTVEDYAARQSFEDEICRNSYYIDIHGVKKDYDNIKLELDMHYKGDESHGIPYRCLIPKGLKNVLVAGRSISCERIVQGSVRVMPVCLAMGEAAGMAAAMAGKLEKVDVRHVDTKVLRQRLREEGAYLPE